ncbi:LemA family protein [Vitreoscilla massiliensis]|uniref:LemA family protein n=1 Tax=Vitreoscilla massiliensis TaxID=1689272 RepID=A0ABY4E0E7_9NEIS|nr:LemA family protein [Vitreoscilla massiliensis]UOO88744.1 LemA family protein [Vitreoscilla massiliensis]
MLKQWMAAMVLAVSLSGCGYNTMQSQDEAANARWSDVLNQYQRRAELVPNLVATVQGYAKHEKEVLTEVTEARAKVGSVQLTGDTATNEQQLKAFSDAQNGLTSALSKLMVVVEKYPELKANANFMDLQKQLEGTENRIAVARSRYIESVQTYNTTVRQFPNNLTAKMFGMQVRPNFTVENEKAISTAPKVSF